MYSIDLGQEIWLTMLEPKSIQITRQETHDWMKTTRGMTNAAMFNRSGRVHLINETQSTDIH